MTCLRFGSEVEGRGTASWARTKVGVEGSLSRLKVGQLRQD